MLMHGFPVHDHMLIYLFVDLAAFPLAFNLHILQYVWVTKLTAESLQNLIQPCSPCQSSAHFCQFTFSSFLCLASQFTLNFSSLCTPHLTLFNIYISEKKTPLSKEQHCYCLLHKANNPCYHNRGRFCFPSCCLYMHEAVANTVCYWLQRGFIRPCGLICSPCFCHSPAVQECHWDIIELV